MGQTKKWILDNFPDPDGYRDDFLSPKCRIWRYGNIEFHFNEINKLSLIYSDYLDELDGGESLKLNKWILDDFAELNLTQVLTELNRQKINYCTTHYESGVKIMLESGVELGFANESDEQVDDPALFIPSYFSFADKEQQ